MVQISYHKSGEITAIYIVLIKLFKSRYKGPRHVFFFFQENDVIAIIA